MFYDLNASFNQQMDLRYNTLFKTKINNALIKG